MTDPAVLDRAYLALQTGGDAELAAELLGLFAAQCGALAPRAADAGLGTDARAEAAHTLKGAALAVGAGRVAAAAAALEAALTRGGAEAPAAAALAVAAREAAEAAGRAGL